MTKDKVIIERADIHAALDKWLDEVEKDPLNIENGERHCFRLEGAGGQYGDADEILVSFIVKTSKEEML